MNVTRISVISCFLSYQYKNSDFFSSSFWQLKCKQRFQGIYCTLDTIYMTGPVSGVEKHIQKAAYLPTNISKLVNSWSQRGRADETNLAVTQRHWSPWFLSQVLIVYRPHFWLRAGITSRGAMWSCFLFNLNLQRDKVWFCMIKKKEKKLGQHKNAF